MGIGLNNIRAPRGAKHRRKIVGRGRGSGHGATSTRGMKGQSSHSGGGPRLGFEGGQMPLVRLIPKRGFSNKSFGKQYNVINLSQLETKFSANDEVNSEILIEKGLINKKLPIKILGEGNLTKPLKIKVNAYSQSAKEKIVAVGGVAEIV